MLLQESIWKIEDKLNTIIESLADHDADLIRIKSKLQALTQRVNLLESKIKSLTKPCRAGSP